MRRKGREKGECNERATRERAMPPLRPFPPSPRTPAFSFFFPTLRSAQSKQKRRHAASPTSPLCRSHVCLFQRQCKLDRVVNEVKRDFRPPTISKATGESNTLPPFFFSSAAAEQTIKMPQLRRRKSSSSDARVQRNCIHAQKIYIVIFVRVCARLN